MWEFEIGSTRTDIKMSGTAGPESPLDVSGAVGGQVVVAFSASFRRHWGDGKRCGCGGINGQGAELSFSMLYTRRNPQHVPARP
jgi:hypothetical protein